MVESMARFRLVYYVDLYQYGDLMVTITLRKAKAGISGYVNRARAGEEFVITNYGKPAARLVPVGAAATLDVGQWLDQLRKIHSDWRTVWQPPLDESDIRFSHSVKKCYWTAERLWALFFGGQDFATAAKLFAICKVAYTAASTSAEVEMMAARALQQGELKPGAMAPIMNALDQAIAVGLILLVPVENNPLSKSLTDAAQQAELQEHLGSLAPTDVLHLSAARNAGCRYIVSGSRTVLNACHLWDLRPPVRRKAKKVSKKDAIERYWLRISLRYDAMEEHRQQMISEVVEMAALETKENKAKLDDLRTCLEHDLPPVLEEVADFLPE